MAAVGVGVVWIAYFLGLWGYCMIRGYNVSPKQLVSTSWPPAAANTQAA
jgi:hypothetical protein